MLRRETSSSHYGIQTSLKKRQDTIDNQILVQSLKSEGVNLNWLVYDINGGIMGEAG